MATNKSFGNMLQEHHPYPPKKSEKAKAPKKGTWDKMKDHESKSKSDAVDKMLK